MKWVFFMIIFCFSCEKKQIHTPEAKIPSLLSDIYILENMVFQVPYQKKDSMRHWGMQEIARIYQTDTQQIRKDLEIILQDPILAKQWHEKANDLIGKPNN